MSKDLNDLRLSGEWHEGRRHSRSPSSPSSRSLAQAWGHPASRVQAAGMATARLSRVGRDVLGPGPPALQDTIGLAPGEAVHPTRQPGDVLVANRGLCPDARLARLAQAGAHAVLRLGAWGIEVIGTMPGWVFQYLIPRRFPCRSEVFEGR